MTVESPTGTPLATPPGSTRSRWGVFAQHDFRQLFFGDSVSQLGTQLTVLAMPILAVRVLHANAFEMGVLGTCEFLAFLVIGLPAGAWVDRWRKKRVLVTGDLVRCAALASLPMAWVLDVLTLPQLFLVALVTGVATVFFDVAYQSYLPDIVEPEQIGEGNARLQAAQSVAMVGGPAIAGGLVRTIGAPLTIGLDALSFLGSASLVSRIRHEDPMPSREGRRPLLVEIREGLAFVFGDALLWRITACTSIGNLCNAMSSAMLVLFALEKLDLDAGHLGLAFAVGSVGGLLGALIANRASNWVGEGRIIPVSALFFTPAGFLMPLAGIAVPPMVALTASSFLMSFGVVLYNVAQVSFRQRLCPRPLLGRMNASIRFIVWGTMPIGAFLGGVLGQAYGPRAVFWIAAVGAVVAALPVLLSPLVRMRELPTELDRLS